MQGCFWLCSAHSHKVLGGCLERFVIRVRLDWLLTGCLLNEGARESLLAGDNAPLQGRGDTITLAHPEGPYMQMHRRITQELNPYGKLGERIEDAALHNPIPHL